MKIEIISSSVIGEEIGILKNVLAQRTERQVQTAVDTREKYASDTTCWQLRFELE